MDTSHCVTCLGYEGHKVVDDSLVEDTARVDFVQELHHCAPIQVPVATSKVLAMG